MRPSPPAVSLLAVWTSVQSVGLYCTAAPRETRIYTCSQTDPEPPANQQLLLPIQYEGPSTNNIDLGQTHAGDYLRIYAGITSTGLGWSFTEYSDQRETIKFSWKLVGV